jgi:hypothetical protein
LRHLSAPLRYCDAFRAKPCSNLLHDCDP